MPRDIPVGNGQMLVSFDQHYRVRDLYFPHVGQENHAGGGPCRFGVWAALPGTNKRAAERRQQRIMWTDEGWQVSMRYQTDTLATDVCLNHDQLRIAMNCCDVVDFHRPVLVRRIELHNQVKQQREVHLVHHQDFHLYGTKVGDTAYYDPQLRSLIHYRKQRYLMACFYVNGEQQIDEYATGTAGFQGAEGTWRDAEDGELGNNPIAQGAVDSTMMATVLLPPNGSAVVYLVIGCGHKREDLMKLHRFIHRESPQGVIDRTVAYWRLWLAATHLELNDTGGQPLGQRVIDLVKRSLLVVRTQIDDSGAIIAANDSDIMQFSRDTYSYLWPRDGAMVADAMDAAGFPDIARGFFHLCAKLIDEDGYFLHKYNPDGSPASSWHPWVAHGKPQLPIQEDETALVIWALWRHYVRYRDVEFVRPLWMRLIQPAADFMMRFRDPVTLLPLPSYDLWEERWGVHAFTTATVYAGLRSAWQFAVCFGDRRRAEAYSKAAEQLRDAFCQHFWSPQDNRFCRRLVPVEQERIAAMMEDVMAGHAARATDGPLYEALPGISIRRKLLQLRKPAFEADATIDASLYGVYAFGLLPVDDERVAATMHAVRQALWVDTQVGGIARYEGDTYHRVQDEQLSVPGNPWFICTLWWAEYLIDRASTAEQLTEAVPILDWVADHALPSGVLAEQVHPQTNQPLSVSPLTWSHATVVATTVKFLNKLDELRVETDAGGRSDIDPTAPLGTLRRAHRIPTHDPVPMIQLPRISA